MEKINLNEYLASNEYPGRGIAVAKAPDGRQMFIAYFIMGRSENSRNRVFDPVPERGGLCTIAADPAKVDAALDLLMVIKYLERIGDHAVNVAEWVQFVRTGRYKDESMF